VKGEGKKESKEGNKDWSKRQVKNNETWEYRKRISPALILRCHVYSYSFRTPVKLKYKTW
jgi:hypothetical protein